MDTIHKNGGRWNNQQGITLIEMAIVMVIAGLLVGSGILMGQSLIRGMHAKEILSMIQDLSAGTRYFKEKYRYLPGDLPLAADDIINTSSTCDFQTSEADVGNGLINNTVIASRDLETDCFTEHLSNAGFIAGGTETLRTRFGLIAVIANTGTGLVADHSTVSLPASILNVIEFADLPWDIAKELDATLDDGDLTTGNIIADIESGTPGNQPPVNMVDAIPFLAVPL